MRPVSPSIDPLAQRAAIDALDAQRAAYRRYARTLEAQRGTLTDGDPDKAAAAVDEATRGYAELQAGAQQLAPTLDRVRQSSNVDELREIQQRVEQLMREAQSAESAIQNLSTQLQSWRDAYGKQLAELGLPPGGDAGGTGGGDQTSDGTVRGATYGSPGFSRMPGPGPSPRILDRKA
jgi:DNA repair exonuclease SbcCD ATPase subunit